MAGLILSIGDTVLNNHINLHKTFEENISLEASIQQREVNYCISKFKRKNQNDNNFLIDKDLSIFCIGNIAYNNSMEKGTLKSIKDALKENSLNEIVSMLDGHFVLFIINGVDEGFSIVTDHFGIMHIYKYFDGNNLYLSTSSLALSRNLKVTLKENSLAQFLRCHAICEFDTIYNEIKLLEPGCIYDYKIQRRTINEQKQYYWKSPTTIEESMNFEEAANLWKNALRETCEKLPREEIICDLTGGYDTRSILATILQYKKLNFDKFSTFVFGPDYSKEVQTVKKISSNLNLPIMHSQLSDDWHDKYFEFIKKSILLTDGEENVCKFAPIMFANIEKSERFNYSINGLGGFIVKSLSWIQEMKIEKRPANINRYINMRTLKGEFDYEIFHDQWKEHIINLKSLLKAKFLDTISDMDPNGTFNTLQLDNIEIRQMQRRWGGRTISSSNRIINVISPLYFKNCIEAGMIIPPKFKKNGRLLRRVITQINPLLARQKMLSGATCEEITLKNLYKFYPLITSSIKKAIKVGVRKFLNQNIFVSQSIDYPRHIWYQRLFSDRKKLHISDIDSWTTGQLYNQKKLKEFINKAKLPGFKYYTQLEKIITLELRISRDRVEKF